MQIYVCVKHVPDTAANIKVVDAVGFDESIKFVINPYDEYGLAAALQLVANDGKGEVVTVTVGKESAVTTIRSALAVGANRGILVKTDRQFIDSNITSRLLKAAIQQDGCPDLIFTGKQSVDSEGMQTHYRLGQAIGMPVATDVVDLQLNDGKVIVEREIGGGAREMLEMEIPCIIGATKGLSEPRYPKLPDILKAKKKEIKQWDVESLVPDLPEAATSIQSLESVPERTGAQMLNGDPKTAVNELVTILKKEKLIGKGD